MPTTPITGHRRLVRGTAVLTTAGIATVLGAGTASAHVAADPERAAPGDSATVTFRVPNERPNASTVGIRVELPTDHPVTSVRTKPIPGWTARVEKVKLPVSPGSGGSRPAEAVRSIVWTAKPGVKIGPDQFDEFDVRFGSLPSDTDQLVLPTTQTYDSGEVVHWDEPPAPPGAGEPEHPAPTLRLVAGGGSGHGNSGQPASGERPGAGGTHADQAASAEDPQARLLGGIGLAAGALGLGLGVGAILRTRRSRS